MTKPFCPFCNNTRVILIAPFQHNNPTPMIAARTCEACR